MGVGLRATWGSGGVPREAMSSNKRGGSSRPSPNISDGVKEQAQGRPARCCRIRILAYRWTGSRLLLAQKPGIYDLAPQKGIWLPAPLHPHSVSHAIAVALRGEPPILAIFIVPTRLGMHKPRWLPIISTPGSSAQT